MNKTELVQEVAARSQLSQKQADAAIKAVFEAITQALKAGDEVRLVGFGTFSTTERKETQGRNPRTGDPLTIPKARLPKFKAGKDLKEKVA